MWSSSGIVGGLNSLGVFPLNFRPEARRLLFRRPGSHEFWSWSWGGVFRRGALRTSSYALVAEVRLRVLGGTVLSPYVFLDFCGGDTSKL